MITLPLSQKGPKAWVGCRALEGLESQHCGIIRTLVYSETKPGLGLIQAKILFCLKHLAASGINYFCLNYWDKCLLGPFPFASIVLAYNGSKCQVMRKKMKWTENEWKGNMKRKKKGSNTGMIKWLLRSLKLKFRCCTVQGYLKLL